MTLHEWLRFGAECTSILTAIGAWVVLLTGFAARDPQVATRRYALAAALFAMSAGGPR